MNQQAVYSFPSGELFEEIEQKFGRIRTRKLLAHRSSYTFRISFQHAEAGQACILKALDEDRAEIFPESQMEFKREFLAYQFMEEHLPNFTQKPRLIDGQQGKWILLEDLGENQAIANSKELYFQVSDTLAKLHAESKYSQAGYLSLARKMGLSKQDNLNNQQFKQGLAVWQQIALRLNLGFSDELMHSFTELEYLIENDLQFHCFIHNDLINERQSVYNRGQFNLIDFEWACWGHPLIDIAKILVGKVEFFIPARCFRFIIPGFSLELAQVFHQRQKHYGDPTFSSSEFERHLQAIILYVSIQQIFRFQTFVDSKEFLPFHAEQDIIRMLRHVNILIQQLGNKDFQPIIRQFLEAEKHLKHQTIFN